MPQVPLPGALLRLRGAMPGAKRWRDDELDALATLMEEAGGEVTDWDALAAQLPNDPDHAIRTGRAAKAQSIKDELLEVAKRRRRRRRMRSQLQPHDVTFAVLLVRPHL
eukprot:COSAG01_NODE_20514_length_949_cov_2.517647_1_plen_109_part_00